MEDCYATNYNRVLIVYGQMNTSKNHFYNWMSSSGNSYALGEKDFYLSFIYLIFFCVWGGGVGGS